MPICEHWTPWRFSEYAVYSDYDSLRKDTVSNGIDAVLKPIEYGQIRIPLRIFHPCLIFDNYQNLAADLPGPVNHIRTGSDITDKIRIVTDRTDRYGIPFRSVRSTCKC